MKPLTWGLSVFALLCSVTFCAAEDWTTDDGRIHKVLSIIKQEGSGVVVLVKDGNYTTYEVISLSALPPDVQRRFHYDPKLTVTLEAQQNAQEEMLKAKKELLQEQDELFTKAQANYNQSEKTIVRGHVVTSTQDSLFLKQRVVDIYLFF